MKRDNAPPRTDNGPITSDSQPPATDHPPLTTVPDHRPLTTVPDYRPLTTVADHRPLTTVPDYRPLTTVPDHSFRVVLFDIDGTLIRAVRRPEYRGRIREMLESVFGTCGRINEVDFGGKTDLAIYREALESEGFSADAIWERLPRLEALMVDILTELAATGEVFRLCAGVHDLLEALSVDTRFVSSLLTGNVEKLAEAKLRVSGIFHYFSSRGAFGGDAEDRDHLPAIAAMRIREHLGVPLPPDRFVIVGDTPRDISCARHFGARVLAVASGYHSMEQLSKHTPDALLSDLGDTQSVVELLATI